MSGMSRNDHGQGPLAGLRIVELASLGPVPFCCQLLGDLGAEILRVQRPRPYTLHGMDPYRISSRNRRSLSLNLKESNGVAALMRLVERADVLLEGFRPGVTERLGIGPDPCLACNPRLIYGRCSGWGRSGPLATVAGHDLNYIGVAGVLSLIGEPGKPPPAPLGLIGDHGGAGMLLTVGVLAGLNERERSGRGQVVDTSIVDGATALSTPYHEGKGRGERTDERWTSMADGASHFYNTYETADGKYITLAAIEPQFYAELLDVLGYDPAELPEQNDRAAWPSMKKLFTDRIHSKTRDEWCALADGRDSCLFPMLTLSEVLDYPHHRERGTFVEVDGVMQPSALPHFSRTAAGEPRPLTPLDDVETALADWGIDPSEARAPLQLDSAISTAAQTNQST
jgi:alpha-methylacyl-CoA racemase